MRQSEGVRIEEREREGGERRRHRQREREARQQKEGKMVNRQRKRNWAKKESGVTKWQKENEEEVETVERGRDWRE